MDGEQSQTGVQRRTVAKGAAWATPVLLVGTPALAANASQDISVSLTGCSDDGFLGLTGQTVTFSVCAAGTPIAAGSTFTYSWTRMNNPPTVAGSFLAASSHPTPGTGANGSVEFTLTVPINPGANNCLTLAAAQSAMTSVPPLVAGATATFALTKAVGNLNGASTANDSATKTFGILGFC